MALIAPEVPEQPIHNVHLQPTADLEAFGGGPGLEQVGQEVQKIAASGGEIAAFEKIKADQSAYEEAANKLTTFSSQVLGEALKSRGTNTISAHDQAIEAVRKQANDISSTLHGEQQKGAFNKYALTHDAEINRTLGAHVASEMEKHYDNTFQSFVKNTTDFAASNYGDQLTRARSLSSIDGAIDRFALRKGMDEEETKLMRRNVHSNFHEQTIDMMMNDPSTEALAKQYYSENKKDMDVETRERIDTLLDSVPRQQQAAAKAQQQEFYKANMRQAMLNMFDGKMSLSEAQRLFRENHIDKSDYDLLETKLSKPDAAIAKSFLVSNPSMFNEIRQAQLTGSKSPGEIQRMIMQGSVSKDITPDDGKYLLTVNSERPPTPRDKEIESNAKTLRDFGSRYFAETNFFGNPTNQEKTSQEAESLVQDFYAQADKTKAKGEDLVKLRDQVLRTYAQKRYPGIGKLDKMPDVVIDVKGKLVRLLNPEQHSGLKPKYKITPTGASDKEDQ